MITKYIIDRLRSKRSKPSADHKHAYPYDSPYHLHNTQTFIQQPGKPVWMDREYSKFANEGYIKNVIAARCVQIIASGASNVKWKLHRNSPNSKEDIKQHPILSLLKRPNPSMGGVALLESLYSAKLISGNSYLLAVGVHNAPPSELHLLRPDRVVVISGKHSVPHAYRYKTGSSYKDYPVNRITGHSQVLHLKSFHPLNDWYGLSPVEAAAYAIDQHNQSGQWNQALLQNGARPSGALIVNAGREGGNGMLSEDQYHRLKNQLEENYSGASNSGRPLLLEGGLEWKEMSLSPRDMDFIETKNSAARDIALAFGVPPQLLGIPGDNKYSNMAEARLSLWEETIIPLIEHVAGELNNWLIPKFHDESLELSFSTDGISALSPKRDRVWSRIESASFLSDQEKREMLGL
ncbi:MAG: phage portal protein [Rickettsiales bacterium]|nr:phage portal protein [Rickettsiales bacterium]